MEWRQTQITLSKQSKQARHHDQKLVVGASFYLRRADKDAHISNVHSNGASFYLDYSASAPVCSIYSAHQDLTIASIVDLRLLAPSPHFLLHSGNCG